MRKLTWITTAFLLTVSAALADKPGVAVISDQPAGVVTVAGEELPKVDTFAGGRVSYYAGPQKAPGVKRAPSPTYVWIAGDGSISYPPSYGWRRPVKYPMRRINIAYDRMYPTYFHGQNAPRGAMWNPVFPQVYQPTDTTQLGYTYQHVPVWQPPHPGFLPPKPHPAQWHHYKVAEPGANHIEHRYRDGDKDDDDDRHRFVPPTPLPTPIDPTPLAPAPGHPEKKDDEPKKKVEADVSA